MNELQKQIGMIGDSAGKFNGQMLFSTGFTSVVETQVGADAGQTIDIRLSDFRSSATTSIGGATWASINHANFSVSLSSAITKVQSAIDYVSQIEWIDTAKI